MEKIERDRAYFTLKYNENENNIAVKDKFIKALEDNKDSKLIEIVYKESELIDCNIDYEWFVGVANYIIGDCTIRQCNDVCNFTRKISVLIK